MPAGSVPDADLVLYLVWSNSGQLGGFGPRTLDVSRMGLDDMRFIDIGSRGDRVTIPALDFAADLAQAKELVSTYEALSGKEVTLSSTSTLKQWLVYLHRVNAVYVPIGNTDPNKNYAIRLQLDCQRTK